MNVTFVYIAVSICFVVLAAAGGREKRDHLDDDGHVFRYQRSAIITIGGGAIVWFFMALSIPLITFTRHKEWGFTPLTASAYIIINGSISALIFYYYKWLCSYRLRISDKLTISTMRGVKCISFDSISRAEIIQGKSSTTMRLFLDGRKKVELSGFLIESSVAFDEITKRLVLIGKCSIRSLSFLGHWTIIQ